MLFNRLRCALWIAKRVDVPVIMGIGVSKKRNQYWFFILAGAFVVFRP